MVNRYSEATRCNGQLEFTLNASHGALSAMKAEATVVRAQLAESGARVAGKIFNISTFFNAPILADILMTF